MEKEKCVLNMSKHYQDLLFYFEKWAEDCSSFLMNNETFCDRSFISEDKCFDSLNVHVSYEEQKMVKQCLEIIFGGFVVVSRRMLHSHLKEGVFSTITEELKKEASSVSTTNAAAERDFAMLDRLKRSKPRALDIVYEGMTMFSLNKTNNWRDGLNENVLHKAMEFARKSKQHQKALYFQSKKDIFLKKSIRLQDNIEEKYRKEKLLVSEREKLLKQINECGGLRGILEVKARLENLETEKEKRMALKIQLNFHQKVLGVKCCQSLFAMTSGGKVKDICVLIKNLKEVVSWSKDVNSNTNAEIDFSSPIFVTQAALEKEKKMFKERAAQTTQKEKEKALGKENIPLGKKQRKRTIEPTKKGNLKKAKESPEAVVTSTDDLVGKVVDHFCYLDDDAEEEEWNRGALIEKTGSSKYLLCYHFRQDILYTWDLKAAVS